MADGNTAAALAGYRIYYGSAPGAYTAHVDVVDARATSGSVTGLSAGTWYFTVAAVDTNGNESSLDYELSKTL
jgi:hypothetical protein